VKLTPPEVPNAKAAVKPLAWQLLAVVVLLLASILPGNHASAAAPENSATRSRSGQFIIHAPPATVPSSSPYAFLTNKDTIRLDPTLLSVSAERIKEFLWRDLGDPGVWRGRVYLELYRNLEADSDIAITSELFRDGWQYRVDLPELIERDRLVHTIVQVLLVELANRDSRGHSAELPPWLVEGLTRGMLARTEIQIILPASDVRSGLSLISTNFSARRNNQIEHARNNLKSHAPLTFEQLSWPLEGQLSGQAGELYRDSAQLFVADLLALKNGGSCLREMLTQLPNYYNWQFAFLHAFHAHFERPLEVEKWWALRYVNFTGLEPSQTWPLYESWQKLDSVLRSPVRVWATTNDLPQHSQVTFQTVLRGEDRARQTQALRLKLRDLEVIRLRMAHELGPLVDDYIQTVEKLLAYRNKITSVLPFRKDAGWKAATAEALKELDALDVRRDVLRPGSTRIAVTPASTNHQNPLPGSTHP
jgi:hypothetical protein